MKRVILLLSALLIFCGGCFSQFSATEANKAKIVDQYPVFSSPPLNKLNYNTVNFLSLFGLTEKFEANPGEVLRTLHKRALMSRESLIWDIIADLCYYQAEQERDEAVQVSYYLSAAHAAWRSLFMPGKTYFETRTLSHYNHAVMKIFEYYKEKDMLLASGHEIEPVCGPRTYFAPPAGRLNQPLSSYKLMEICASWCPYNNQVFTYRRGLGVPLILHAPPKRNREAAAENTLRTQLFEPATVILRFPAKPGNDRGAVRWEFADSMHYENISFQGVKLPLSMDITTPLAYALNQPNKFKDIYFMLHPEKMADLSGLYMMHEFDPEKIPVVFTHGLMSNPRTWAQMLNGLYLDPRLRRHYQFWLFAYPTGNPILYSAFQLRSALLLAEARFGKDNENFKKMVLVGHSMGGLLSKTIITEPGDELAHYMLEGKEGELSKVSAEQRDFINQVLRFKRPDFVKRAVFIATPHRGSEIARWSVVHWLAGFITLPSRFYGIVKGSMEVLNILPDSDEVRVRSGLDNLAPDDRVLVKLNELNYRTVPFHSIIGNNAHDSDIGGTDGVVPYTSSHLDGAASELIVRSTHGVQKTQKAIAEMNRILIQHLIECGRLSPDGVELKREMNTLPEEPF